MGYPEDEVDFEDTVNGLTIEEIAALKDQGLPSKEPSVDLRIRGGKLVTVKTAPDLKVPCAGSTPPIDRTLPELRVKVSEIYTRQDKLANTCTRTFERISKRLVDLEGTPTPFWVLGPIQKSCCLLFGGWALMLMLLFGLALASHFLGFK